MHGVICPRTYYSGVICPGMDSLLQMGTAYSGVLYFADSFLRDRTFHSPHDVLCIAALYAKSVHLTSRGSPQVNSKGIGMIAAL